MMAGHYVALVGRNIIDFLNLVISCKDASVLESISYISEEGFNELMGAIEANLFENPEYSKVVDEAIFELKKAFDLQIIDNVYRYVKETQGDLLYHSKLNFSQTYYDAIGN